VTSFGHLTELGQVRNVKMKAIRAYPSQYAKAWQFEDGTNVMIRPIRPDDEPLMVRFHATLSDRSVYLRYFHMMNLGSRVEHERLARLCSVDYDREIALVVERGRDIVAVGRLVKAEDANEAEFAVVISDEFHGHGLGTELLRRLLEIARDDKLERVTADILPDNDHMLRVCKLLGFQLKHSMEEHVVKASISLQA
jgi:acetyltransferase